MRRGVLLTFVVAGALSLGVAEAAAQPILTVSGGATLPTGDYGEYANTGYMVIAGVMFPIGTRPIMIGGHAMYGSNSHSDYDGDKTNLTGVVATALYRFGDPTRPGLYVFGNLGMLRHASSSEMFPDEEGNESGVAFGAGAGVSIPRGRLNLHAHAGFLTASMDGSSTAFIPIVVGVSIPLGSR